MLPGSISRAWRSSISTHAAPSVGTQSLSTTLKLTFVCWGAANSTTAACPARKVHVEWLGHDKDTTNVNIVLLKR